MLISKARAAHRWCYCRRSAAPKNAHCRRGGIALEIGALGSRRRSNPLLRGGETRRRSGGRGVGGERGGGKEPEPEPAPEADEEECSEEEEEDADELMPEPTLRGRVAPGMVPFMARAAARSMPPAPRREPPPVVVTPESFREEEPVKLRTSVRGGDRVGSAGGAAPGGDGVGRRGAARGPGIRARHRTRRGRDLISGGGRHRGGDALNGLARPRLPGDEARSRATSRALVHRPQGGSVAGQAGASIERLRPVVKLRRDLKRPAKRGVTITVHHANLEMTGCSMLNSSRSVTSRARPCYGTSIGRRRSTRRRHRGPIATAAPSSARSRARRSSRPWAFLDSIDPRVAARKRRFFVSEISSVVTASRS